MGDKKADWTSATRLLLLHKERQTLTQRVIGKSYMAAYKCIQYIFTCGQDNINLEQASKNIGKK